MVNCIRAGSTHAAVARQWMRHLENIKRSREQASAIFKNSQGNCHMNVNLNAAQTNSQTSIPVDYSPEAALKLIVNFFSKSAFTQNGDFSWVSPQAFKTLIDNPEFREAIQKLVEEENIHPKQNEDMLQFYPADARETLLLLDILSNTLASPYSSVDQIKAAQQLFLKVLDLVSEFL